MKTCFPNLFKSREKYRVILKSGASFVLTASNVKVTFNSETMALHSYNFSDPKGELPFHCSPLEIAAILKIS